MSANGAFKSIPTLDEIVRRLKEAETCLGAQGEVLNFVLTELQEREMEVAFLMSLIHVVIPQSNIADANGKIPATRKLAAQLWNEEGRAKMLAVFTAKQKAIQDAENLQATADASKQSPQAAGDRETSGPHEFSIPGKVTH